jgi:hypothetical protein
MLHPEIAAKAAAVADRAGILVRLADCAGLDRSGLRLGAATGSTQPGMGADHAGTTVTLRVSTVFAASGVGGAPLAVEREWTLGIPADNPGRIDSIGWNGLHVGAGIGTTSLPDRTMPSWDTELLTPPAAPNAESAAAVIQALAATLATDTVAVSLRQEMLTDGEEPNLLQGTGVLIPDSGQAQMVFEDGGFREVRVLDFHRQFGDYPGSPDPDTGGTWHLYETGAHPGLAEGSTSHNPYAALDWLRSLSAAAPTTCPEDVEAGRCYAVTVPTADVLTPGTPGYREATVHARRGNSTMTMVVGVTDGRLAAVVVGLRHGHKDGAPTRVTSTWTYAPWGEDAAPVIERPPFWTDPDS